MSDPARECLALLDMHSRRRPDTVALVFDAASHTYGAVRAAVEDYALELVGRGIRAGDVVGVYGHPRPECLLMFLAAASIGAVYLGLNPKHGARELSVAVGDARPSVVFATTGEDDPAEREKLAAVERAAETRVEPWTGPGPRAADAAELARLRRAVSPGDPSALVYTSGTTGRPKGALLSQAGMLRSAELTWRHWFGGVTPRMLAQHPINHVGWLVCECLAGLAGGGTLVFRERFDAAATLRRIESDRLNVWVTLPSMLILCMRTPEFESCDLSSLERVALGGSLPVHLLESLTRKTGAVASNSYGLTEAGGGVLTITDDAAPLGVVSGSIGRFVPEVEGRLVQADGREAPDGAEGEIWVRDECVFLGYLGQPEATSAALTADGWLRTGDTGATDRDGNLRLVGRLKEMYKSGGYNVYPSEVELVLGGHPAIASVCVVGVPHELWGEVGAAFVVPASRGEMSAETVVEAARAGLANYKVPKHVFLVEELPRLGNGKVDRTRLKGLARERAAAPR